MSKEAVEGFPKPFRTQMGYDIFKQKYAHEGAEEWGELAHVLVEDVCKGNMPVADRRKLETFIAEMKFIPGGRYLYYAGRPNKFFNNCYLLKSLEDSREDWANLSWKSETCLMTGGGIGNDYSMYRPAGSIIKKTGGKASGVIPKMKMINEIGRNVMQGGSRRSAIYGSLNWRHGDINEFLHCKDWYNMPVSGAYNDDGKNLTIGQLKEKDFNYPAPLDMTNISLNYDNHFLETVYDMPIAEIEKKIYEESLPFEFIPSVFIENVRQALKTAEPGFSFNFFDKENETLRNACVTGETEILTKVGYQRIDSIIDSELDIWNGFEWSTVTPKVTGEDEDIIKVTLSDGRSIKCTNYHIWHISKDYRGNIIKKETKSLTIGDKIIKSTFPVVEFDTHVEPNNAYTQGFYSADGNKNSNDTWVYETKYMCIDRLSTRQIGNEYKNHNGVGRFMHKANFDLMPKEFIPFTWNVKSKMQWLAGLFDGDGCELKEGGIQLVSVDNDFLLGLQKLLSLCGIQSKIVFANNSGMRKLPDGKGGHRYYMCKESNRLCIGATQVQDLKGLGMHCSRLTLDKCPNRDASQFVKIISIEDYGKAETVYCFNEPKNHTGIFNGIVTGQCTEVTSEDDSDVCNLGSANMSRIESLEEFKEVVRLGSQFLLCGTLRAKLPYKKVEEVREQNRRLGLGLMGVHEWLLQRDYKYEMNDEFREWLKVYESDSESSANKLADKLEINHPKAYRAIAPTGTISIISGTSSGIEPLFAVAYKRRYLKGQHEWHYQYVVDGMAKLLIESGVDPDNIESAVDLAKDPERRIKFQADIQDYVDMSISSTINIEAWGTETNNETRVYKFAKTLLSYAHRLRGFTCYPDGARGGQPITSVPYSEALQHEGKEFKEEFHDVCEMTGSGKCGI